VEGSPAELKRDIGGDSVALTPSTDSSADDVERMANVLRALPRTNSVEQLADSVVVYLEDGGSRIAEIVRAIDAAGVQLGRLELAEPSLDQVFLKHTGARLRVDEVKPQSRMSRNRMRP
jgi:ABC-2 type transport system ATP-binding protein